MKIVLHKFKKEDEKIAVEDKEYQIPFVPSGAFLEYLEIEEEIENMNILKPSEMKKLAGLIVKTFDNQFTEKEFFDGVPSYLLMSTFNEFIGSLNKNPYASKQQSVTESEKVNAEKKAV